MKSNTAMRASAWVSKLVRSSSSHSSVAKKLSHMALSNQSPTEPIDDRLNPPTIAYPEFHGNGVMSSMGNISENPHIGLIFIDFTKDRIGLHVNGSARIVENEEFVRLMKDHPAGEGVCEDPALARIMNSDAGILERWVMVTVDEAFIHCSKHIPLMRKVELDRKWGTDDVRAKGGDYFVAASGQQ